jgi:hypothetical protein
MAGNTHESITLEWHRFKKLTDARRQFKTTPCIYIQTDCQGKILRIGKAENGLEVRYRGGTGYALDAAMHGSKNQLFVASLEATLAIPVELLLIYQLQPPYNNQGKIKPPTFRLSLKHCGDLPYGLPDHPNTET